MMEVLPLILVSILTAATPLLLAALGEHVVERAGVLNLGVEGMMLMGASAGFAAAFMFDSSVLGLVVGALFGVGMACVSGFFTIGLATNQVATGLALTLFGTGLSGLIGQDFVGQPREALPLIEFPFLSDLPFLGQVLFRGDGVFYLSLVLLAGVAFFLHHTRAGLLLRAVGENQTSAHALGIPVRKIRFLALLFGGLMAGLAGAYLSLIYTRFWSPGMSAGRGWIALALVVFGAGYVWRLVFGAYLFGAISVAQLHAQAGSIALPSQFLSALPYVMTIFVLLALALSGKKGEGASGSLGQTFVPDQ